VSPTSYDSLVIGCGPGRSRLLKHPRTSVANARGRWLKTTALMVLACAAAVCAGCRTAQPLPPADFSAPGWRVQQGQAVWKPLKNKTELAGELLLATNGSGSFFVQFSKTPFPLAMAQVAGERWEIVFGPGEHAWRGRGQPPGRFAWFQLSQALAGESLPRDWKFSRIESHVWRLENARTGETLEGEFHP
jgi:hypothetical protein